MPQNQVTGMENRSVLLPASYDTQYQRYIKVSWSFQAFETPFLIWSLQNVSGNCSRQFFSWRSYRHRVTFFPENASLLLQDLRLNDTGTYCVKIKGDLGSALGLVKLKVLPGKVTEEETDGIQEHYSKTGRVNSTRTVNIIRIALASLLTSLSFVALFVDMFLK
ncbi:uncharacterized protein LOC144496832 isoform X2 [Mustelus asterias]